MKQADAAMKEGEHINALLVLNDALRNKKNKGQHGQLEKIIVKIIQISIDQLTTQSLKDDISHYRNIMQHVNVNSIKDVLERLRGMAEERIEAIVKKCGNAQEQK